MVGNRVVPGLLVAVGVMSTAACGTGTSMFAAFPEVSGKPGTRPEVRIPKAKPDDEPRLRVLEQGRGSPVRKGQAVIANVDIRTWGDGKTYLDTWRAKQPTTVVLDGSHVARTWDRALLGRKPGARVLLVTPATQGFGPKGMAPARVKPHETLVEVFDVIGGYDPAAQVSGPQRPGGEKGVPDVVVEPGREPRVVLPGGAPPNDLLVRTLVQGNGRQVTDGATAVVNYTGVTWDGEVFDSSYRRGGPNGFVMDDRHAPPGWARALRGVRSGSRVLITVPDRLKKGFTMTPGGVGAPPGKAVVYVLDLLDVR